MRPQNQPYPFGVALVCDPDGTPHYEMVSRSCGSPTSSESASILSPLVRADAYKVPLAPPGSGPHSVPQHSEDD